MEVVCKQRGTWDNVKDRYLKLRAKRVAAELLP